MVILMLFSQFIETEMGFIYTHKGKKAFIVKPFKAGKYIARVKPETSRVFINILNVVLENTKGYSIFVYPESPLKVDDIRYYGNVVENIPEGVHYVEIPRYVKGEFIFKDYDMIVFILRGITETYEERQETAEEKVSEVETYEKPGTMLGFDEEVVSQGAGLICGVMGCVLGSVIGAYIFPAGNSCIGCCIGGAVGTYLGYEVCRSAAKSCVK